MVMILLKTLPGRSISSLTWPATSSALFEPYLTSVVVALELGNGGKTVDEDDVLAMVLS